MNAQDQFTAFAIYTGYPPKCGLLVSRSITQVMGASGVAKLEMDWGTPSSLTRKLPLLRPVTGLPLSSATTTSSVTRGTSTVMVYWSGVFCCSFGALGTLTGGCCVWSCWAP